MKGKNVLFSIILVVLVVSCAACSTVLYQNNETTLSSDSSGYSSLQQAKTTSKTAANVESTTSLPVPTVPNTTAVQTSASAAQTTKANHTPDSKPELLPVQTGGAYVKTITSLKDITDADLIDQRIQSKMKDYRCNTIPDGVACSFQQLDGMCKLLTIETEDNAEISIDLETTIQRGEVQFAVVIPTAEKVIYLSDTNGTNKVTIDSQLAYLVCVGIAFEGNMNVTAVSESSVSLGHSMF